MNKDNDNLDSATSLAPSEASPYTNSPPNHDQADTEPANYFEADALDLPPEGDSRSPDPLEDELTAYDIDLEEFLEDDDLLQVERETEELRQDKDLFASQPEPETPPAADAPPQEAFAEEETFAADEGTTFAEPGEPIEPEHVETEPNSAKDSDAEPWPVGLIAVAVFALILLAAGGYGVMQERAAAQEEIRQLQAALATTVSSEEIQASRDAVRTLEAGNIGLQSQLDTLRTENAVLRGTQTGLEKQLAAQQLRLDSKTTAKASPPASKPIPAVSSATTAGWFVNFGSYGRRATADKWAQKIQASEGQVVVVAAKSNGSNLYRVRVIAIGSKTTAEKIARKLEQTYDLSTLWVGRQ